MSLTPQTASLNLSSVASSAVTNQLAIELAAGLYSMPQIMEKFGLSKTQMLKIAGTAQFKAMFQEAKALWEKSSNVKQRTRLKAALLLEDSVLPLFSLIHNGDISPGARIDAFAKLMAVADMQPSKDSGSIGGGEGFKLNIIIGGDVEQSVVIEGASEELGNDKSVFKDLRVESSES